MSKNSQNPNALLEAWFLGERDVAPADVAAAGDAISRDAQLAERFDSLALADRALQDSDEPTDFERDFGRAWFDASLDAMLAEEREEQDDSHGGKTDNVVQLRPRKQPIAAWASAAAVLLMGAFTLTQAPTVAPPAFQARTAAVAGWQPRPDAPKLMAFCVERQAGEVVFNGPDEAPFGVVACPNDAELKLAVEKPGDTWKWAAFFGVYEDGTVLWYGPTPVAPKPVALDSTQDLQPIGESIRLGVNHKPGPVRVHALFTTEPVDFDQLEKWVGTHAPELFDNAMIVEPAVGTTGTQLFEVKP